MRHGELVKATNKIINEYRRFADEVLPQAGGIVLAVGSLNDGLIFAAKIKKKLENKND